MHWGIILPIEIISTKSDRDMTFERRYQSTDKEGESLSFVTIVTNKQADYVKSKDRFSSFAFVFGGVPGVLLPCHTFGVQNLQVEN